MIEASDRIITSNMRQRLVKARVIIKKTGNKKNTLNIVADLGTLVSIQIPPMIKGIERTTRKMFHPFSYLNESMCLILAI